MDTGLWGFDGLVSDSMVFFKNGSAWILLDFMNLFPLKCPFVEFYRVLSGFIWFYTGLLGFERVNQSFCRFLVGFLLFYLIL